MQKDKENKTLNKDKPIPGLALALGSGVARGFAHIGVLRVLKKNGIIIIHRKKGDLDNYPKK